MGRHLAERAGWGTPPACQVARKTAAEFVGFSTPVFGGAKSTLAAGASFPMGNPANRITVVSLAILASGSMIGAAMSPRWPCPAAVSGFSAD